MTSDDAQVRQDICAGCAQRCPAPAPLDPCFACPLGIYQTHAGCGRAGEPGPGTQAAGWIERHVLSPIEAAVPGAGPLVRRMRICGGCKADAARLDGDGGGSTV